MRSKQSDPLVDPGEGDTDLARLDHLAEHHLAQGAYAQAEPLYRRALRIRETRLGPEHLDVAGSLDNLAALYMAQDAYVQATPLCERALRIHETALGVDHPDVTTSLDTLAALYRVQGAHDKAAPLLERVLGIRERALGPEHPDVATSLENLATLYRAQGAYAQAAPLFERVLGIRERALGPDHPDVATLLHDLAVLYDKLGVYAQVKPLRERALRIREMVLGPEHPDVADSLDSLAKLHRAQGAYAQAEPLCERALRIRETALGADHLDVADSLDSLAALHQAQGAYAPAEPLYERALRIRETALGAEHPDVARSLDRLAALYEDQGAHAQVVLLYERALRIRETALGADHPDVARSLNNLAQLHWSTGDVSQALRDFVRAIAIQERHLGLVLATLTEERKRQFLQTTLVDAEVLVSFHAHGAPDDVEALALTLTTTLRRKGRVLAEVVSGQTAMRRHLSPALRAELDSLQERRNELATRRQAASDPRHADALRALAREVQRLEAELSRKSAVFRAHEVPLTIESVQAALPLGTTLVEFMRYQRFDAGNPRQPWREAHYVAYILQREGPPRWMALGEAEPIEAAVRAALSALARPGDDARELLRALDELAFAPIRRRLGPADHFLLSPDAALHRVPFAALVDEDGHHLIERMRISYVTSGRDLVRPDVEDAARSRPLVVAAPAHGDHHAPLPGAESEADAIRKHFADIDIYVGALATKAKLTAAQGPLFVHVATHGFFRTSRVSASSRAARAWRKQRDITEGPAPSTPLDHPLDIEDALDDAGLIFAGDSEPETTLTAREIASIDLRGTQLIVVSACDSGIGEVHRSEGIYGLRRAIAIAGAQTQVVSLWQIDDAATSQLMDRYYGALRSGEGRSEALRHAQLELLRDGRHSDPFYWAAFLPIGNEKPLEP